MGYSFWNVPRAGLNSLPRPARSALNQEVRQGSCEWLCHSWDAGSESSLVTLFAFAVCEAYKQQNLWTITERNTIRQDGVFSVSINPHPCHSEPVTDVTGVGIRNLLAGNLRKSAGIMRFGNGLPRQCAYWLAMTGFFDSLRNTIRQDGVFFLECRRQVIERERGIAAHFRRSSWPLTGSAGFAICSRQFTLIDRNCFKFRIQIVPIRADIRTCEILKTACF